MSLGDIITLSSRPPAGAILVGQHGCSKPMGFDKVAYHSADKITIWRPRVPDDEQYVSLEISPSLALQLLLIMMQCG